MLVPDSGISLNQSLNLRGNHKNKEEKIENIESSVSRQSEATIADVLKTALALKVGKKQTEITNKKISFVGDQNDRPYKAMFQRLLENSFKDRIFTNRRIQQNRNKRSQIMSQTRYRLNSKIVSFQDK